MMICGSKRFPESCHGCGGCVVSLVGGSLGTQLDLIQCWKIRHRGEYVSEGAIAKVLGAKFQAVIIRQRLEHQLRDLSGYICQSTNTDLLVDYRMR